VKIDLHGYHPDQLMGEVFDSVVRQAWETGAEEIEFIHGHGRGRRGVLRGFVNTNTGYFGLRIRRELRHNKSLRQWIKYTTLSCAAWGSTSVRLKANKAPSRTQLDDTALPAPWFPHDSR
jgi:hypothetical protein